MEPAIKGRQDGIIETDVVGRHDEAVAGARVRGEDAGDHAGTNVAAKWVFVVEVEVERSGVPYMALAGGEDLRAGAVFGGEKGDDVAEDVVGEAADLVNLSRSPFLGSREDPHGGAARRGMAAGGGGGFGIWRRRALR
jgi:hypothetical protein